ncbi:MAG: FliG C-terminal domain-containing protein [Pseudomonadota bacterium]
MKKLNLMTYLAIRDIPAKKLLLLLEQMSDVSGAVVLMNLESRDSLDMIRMLPQKKRDRMVQCLIDLESAEEAVQRQVLEKVEKEILNVLATRYDSIDINERLAELICHFQSSQRVAVLDLIRDKKKMAFSQIRKKIIEYKEKHEICFFEDILSFPDEDLRDRIQDVDTRKIAIAVKEADAAIKTKIMENMPRRIREMVTDDLQNIESLTVEQIDEAQNAVIKALMNKKTGSGFR